MFLIIILAHALFIHQSLAEYSPEVSRFSRFFVSNLITDGLIDTYNFPPLTREEIASTFGAAVKKNIEGAGLDPGERPRLVAAGVLDTAPCLATYRWAEVYGNVAGRILEHFGYLSTQGAPEILASRFVNILSQVASYTVVAGHPKTNIYTVVDAFVQFLLSKGLFTKDTLNLVGMTFNEELYAVSGCPKKMA